MTDALVATQRGLYRTGSAEPVAFEGRDVTALSPDARWAIVARRELWRHAGSWERMVTAEIDLHCVLETDGEVYTGTHSAHLLRLSNHGLEEISGFEKVEGREDWFTPWGGPPDARSLAVGADDELYVNVHVGGIVKGMGDSWEPTLDIGADVHEVRTSGKLIVAACAVGLAESGDGGFAWNYDDEGLHATYARAIAVGDDYLFMSTSHGPRGGDAAIYRQPCDGDRAFERCDLPSFPDNIDTGCLDARGSTAVFGTRKGEVFASDDHGDSWNALAEDLPPVHHVVIER
jgi:hypothetical protein